MTTAKLFKTGRSQAVRLPKEFRFEGKEVRIRREGNGVLLEPMKKPTRDWQAFWREIDRLVDGKFMEQGRQQPPMPPDEDMFD
ncbi:MAG: AbrB/MazE/SpoVT family DNA-binding domain-containing protein [Alphaproteobacteria bacterium]|nr:AbrB/MazE/SpoVT family DNA-binding domain-containing protein [Alphaproteobacteria bacterium]